MPSLVTPTVDVHASFVAAMAEFRAQGGGTPDDIAMIGFDIRDLGPEWGVLEDEHDGKFRFWVPTGPVR